MMQSESIQSHLTTPIKTKDNENWIVFYSLSNHFATSIASLKVGGNKDMSMP